jgi:hypothetical protein
MILFALFKKSRIFLKRKAIFYLFTGKKTYNGPEKKHLCNLGGCFFGPKHSQRQKRAASSPSLSDADY